jgi:hypothetical protein
MFPNLPFVFRANAAALRLYRAEKPKKLHTTAAEDGKTGGGEAKKNPILNLL